MKSAVKSAANYFRKKVCSSLIMEYVRRAPGLTLSLLLFLLLSSFVFYRDVHIWYNKHWCGLSLHKNGYRSYALIWCLGETNGICVNSFPPIFRSKGPLDTGYLGPIELWFTTEAFEK